MDEKVGVLIKHQLENLLGIIAFENESGHIDVDGFSVRPQPLPIGSVPTNIRWESLESFQNAEPRLVMIGRFLSQLLQFIQLEYKGCPVSVAGFRLHNLARWATYRFPSLFSNLNFECLTSACSCKCDFCFLDGMGPHKLPRRHMTMQEARTRARYFSAEKKTGLPIPNSIPGEPMLHPHFLDFLRLCRESDSEECFYITTNGDFLTRELIEELVRLKPVSICVSLNSADLKTRTAIMKSGRALTAIKSIPLLQEYQIPFIGSIVTAPCFSLEDVEETARYLDHHQSLMIRLLLPGHTRFQSVTTYDRDRQWGAIAVLGQRLRAELQTPIFLQPNFYWDQEIAPRVDGVYRNSPAAHAGMRPGDLILEIDGNPIFTKAEVQDAFQQKPSTPRTIRFSRNGIESTICIANELAPEDDFYPFKPRGYRMGTGNPDGYSLGIQVAQGFRIEYLRYLKDCIEKHPDAKRVLIFTTPLVKNHLAQAMTLAGSMPECRLENVEARISIAPQNYWGGNIIVGDLNVTQDYIDHIKTLEGYNYRPDLIIIPRSFVTLWGFDVSGTSYAEIERSTGIPVELLAVERIMW